jgi:hypothetical protein
MPGRRVSGKVGLRAPAFGCLLMKMRRGPEGRRRMKHVQVVTRA